MIEGRLLQQILHYSLVLVDVLLSSQWVLESTWFQKLWWKWWYCHAQKCNNKHLFWKGSIHGWWWTSKLYMSYIRFLLSSSEFAVFTKPCPNWQIVLSWPIYAYPSICRVFLLARFAFSLVIPRLAAPQCLGDACLRLPAETDRTSLQSRRIQLDVGRYLGNFLNWNDNGHGTGSHT